MIDNERYFDCENCEQRFSDKGEFKKHKSSCKPKDPMLLALEKIGNNTSTIKNIAVFLFIVWVIVSIISLFGGI